MTARTLRCSSMVIALTGFMGCGKSSVGRELSMLLGIPLIDLDQYIVKKAGRSIPDIFAQDGETAFRNLESEALKELLSGVFPLEKVLRTPPKLNAWVPPSYVAEGGTFFEGEYPAQNNLILSLGGGTILRPENAALIKERCKCFFLRASEETLRLHLGGEQSQRPLLRSGGFEALLRERTPLYTAAADFIIDVDSLSPMQVAGIIANLIS